MIAYKIAAICLKGSQKEKCDDNILIMEKLLGCGFNVLEKAYSFFAFVADGIGGNLGGDFAASTILKDILNSQPIKYLGNPLGFENQLKTINRTLIQRTQPQTEIKGAGTTLVGLMASQEKCLLIYAGDSEAWLLRSNEFSRLTFPQNLDPFKENSPLVSYFGGEADQLDLQIETSLGRPQSGDILLLCSDGLFKVFDESRIKLILSNKQPLQDKAQFIYQKSQETYRPDDLSCILVEVQEEEDE